MGVVAALTVTGIFPCAAQAPLPPRMSVLAADTNATFSFLPPPPDGASTNQTAEIPVVKPVKLKHLPRDGASPLDLLRSTVNGKPGEKEADAEQRPNIARDAAAAAQRDQIIATTPVLPPEPPPDEKKQEKELWINAKPKDEMPPGPQMPFDTWVLQPGEGRAAPATQLETFPEQPPRVAQPVAPFDFTPSPFDLGPANKPAVHEPTSARGILSANPIELPLFGTRHETTSPFPQPPKPPVALPPSVTATRAPSVSPSSPFAPVEFSRDSPFGARPPAQGSPLLGGAVVPQPFPPGSPAAVPRPPFANPFPAETLRVPVKTRDEQAAEKWEKHFEDRKRGF